MPYCSVKWCGKCSTTSSIKKDGISFHRFPNCPEIKRKWINATKRDGNNWFPGKKHVICSRHFTKDCFRLINGNRRFLFETAVPTLMLPSLSNQDPEEDLEEDSEEKPDVKPVTTDQDEEMIIITPDIQSTSSVDAIYTPLSGSVQNIHVKPSTSAESETVKQDKCKPDPQQNTNVNSLSRKPCNYSSPTQRERRLYRAVIDLSQKVKNKNLALKRLRDSNRMLKRKVILLKQLLGEMEKNN